MGTPRGLLIFGHCPDPQGNSVYCTLSKKFDNNNVYFSSYGRHALRPNGNVADIVYVEVGLSTEVNKPLI